MALFNNFLNYNEVVFSNNFGLVKKKGGGSGIFTNQLVGLLPGRQSQGAAPQGTALNRSNTAGNYSD